MSNQNVIEAINKTVSGVLEQTAFMFPEPVDLTSGIPFEDYEYVMVKLNFSGDQIGNIKMIIPVDFCAELSANLLGEDIGDVDPEENNFDSARELLNIVAGQLLIDLYGEKALFSLTDLMVEKLDKVAITSMIENCEYHCCMVDDYPVISMFTVQGAGDECKSLSS